MMDCELVFYLAKIKDVVKDTFAMAKVCGISTQDVILRAQGIKTESLVLWLSKQQGYILGQKKND